MADRGVAPYRFRAGDAVIHPARPEWGTGTIRQAAMITHQGAEAQRLVIDFARKGRLTINTGVAPLRLADATHSPEPGGSTPPRHTRDQGMTQTDSTGGWLAQLERKATGREQTHELWELPEELTDPFLNDAQRLAHTLETYRYSTEPRSLIDWAIRQTGLDDPLTKYTRTDMEQAFPRFARDRDHHLKDLVRQLKRNGQQAVLREARNKSQIPAAVSALDRAMRG